MKGMLGDLFTPSARTLRDDELDKERVHQWQAQDPFKAMAHASYSGATLAGEGLARAGVAAAGGDPRTRLERNVEAVEAAKQQVAALGFNPDDPKSIDEFYKRVIQILQKQGLAAEALAVGKEWNAEKHKTAKSDIELRDLQRREDRDRRAAELGIMRVASAREIAAAKNATAKEIADAKLTAEQLKDGPFKSIDYGDHVEVINRFGEVISSKPKALNPKDEERDANAKRDAEQAYGEYLAGLQRQYDAAVQLHNHPGVDGITGRFARHVGTDDKSPVLGTLATTLAGKDARGALALHNQVVGGAFLAGLAKLKNASPNKSTGLGAVSEKEGDKVQSDAAALDRAQEAADYRKQLAIYIQEMEGFAQRLAAGAQQDKIAPKPLATKPLNGAPAAKPAAVPAAAPAAPAGAPKVERWERGADGKLKRVGG